MKTQIVYVLVSSEKDLYLEELWTSLYSLRHFHPTERVVVLVDAPTAERIIARPQLAEMISELKVVDVPEKYAPKDRSREIKTSIRNLIEGDFLFIDTDTVVTRPLDAVDDMDVKNIAMVPELHGPFVDHITYDYVTSDTKRIFDADVADSPYWFNSGCMLVKDNSFTREFFKKWNENWQYSAFHKNNSTDQRALLKTDHDYGYIIESLPGTYNCQVAMSIQYFHEAHIVHFWHMRRNFTPNMDYSPFMSHDIYRQIREKRGITSKIADIILNCKSSFQSPTMICGKNEIQFLFSPFHTVLWKSYNESRMMHWFVDKFIYCVNLYYRAKRKLVKK